MEDVSHIIISDLHLDKKTFANTTEKSRNFLRAKKFSVLISKLKRLKVEHPNAILIDTGDLFDSHKISDNITFQYAIDYLNLIDHIIQGNHDALSVKDSVTSLGICNSIFGDGKVILNKASVDSFYIKRVGDMVFLPHVSNSVQFKLAIEMACDNCKPSDYLFTHANLMMSEDINNFSMLNITSEMVNKLSKRFKQVFVGHTHKHFVTGCYANVISVGCAFPSNFSDCASDSGILLYSAKHNKFEREIFYSSEKSYKEIYANTPVDDAGLFNRLMGNWTISEAMEMRTKLYSLGAGAVMLPNFTEITTKYEFNNSSIKRGVTDFSALFRTYMPKKMAQDFINYIRRIK